MGPKIQRSPPLYRLALSCADCRSARASNSLVITRSNSSNASSVAFASRYTTVASNVASRFAYGLRRRNDVARCIDQKFCKPFEHFLDLLGIGLLQVLDAKRDPYIRDAACDFAVGLHGG